MSTLEYEKGRLGAFTFLPLKKKSAEPPKTQSRKVIVLSGATACGKTTLSLLLASKLKGEIISADSVQVYRGMDIGTAKVSQEDQMRIPHHLIDIRSLQESFNVIDFFYEACQCCNAILARGNVPIVVGGSGFYLHALLYGIPHGPPSVPDLRSALEKEMQSLGPEAMYQRLQSQDPTYAKSVTKNDRQKIVRALEIMTLTGEKVSALKWERKELLSDYQFCCWFLYRPRDVLVERINARCEQMLEAGLVDEVEQLKKQGLALNASASQAIGYRQCLEFLETSQDAEEYQKFVQKFKKASRLYAKRQFTWFRKEPLFRWLDVEMHDFEIAADMILQDFQKKI